MDKKESVPETLVCLLDPALMLDGYWVDYSMLKNYLWEMALRIMVVCFSLCFYIFYIALASLYN